MRLTCISVVKDESDFIERFIRINGQVIDDFYIVDDNSTDETVNILHKLANEGYKITIKHVIDRRMRIQMRQADILNQTKSMIFSDLTLAPSHIIPLDADELIFLDRESLEKELKKIKENEHGRMRWTTFVPTNGSLSSNKLLKECFQPLAAEKKDVFKVIIPGTASRDSLLSTGSHHLHSNTKPINLDIELCHFPIRSINQLIAKALTAANKMALKRDRKPGDSYHILNIADQISARGYTIKESQLQQYALSYLGDERPREFKIMNNFLNYPETTPKYWQGDINVIAILNTFTLELIEEINELRGASPDKPNH